MGKAYKFATRTSALALWQTRHVIAELSQKFPLSTFEEYPIVTRGDKVLDKPLPEIGGKGLFTEELESALFSGAADCATHSLKDLPVDNPAGLVVGCIPARAEARDVMISPKYQTLEKLPYGAVVGTSSLRRAAQILAIRPDLKTRSIRGNVETRIRKVVTGEYDAVILAGAGITRLGLADQVTQWFEFDTMLPAPGQGALAVQCRADDAETLAMLMVLEDPDVRAQIIAERAFLQGLGGGCSVPVAAYAAVQGTTISLTGLVIAPDGTEKVQVSAVGENAEKLGKQLAELAISKGALALLSNHPTLSGAK